MLGPFRMEMNGCIASLKKALQEIVQSQDQLRVDLNDLTKRAGEFTGMSAYEVTRLVSAKVIRHLSKDSAENLVNEVLAKYYGESTRHPPARHSSLRKRLGLK